MRLRTSNRAKSYRPSDLVPDQSSSSEEDQTPDAHADEPSESDREFAQESEEEPEAVESDEGGARESTDEASQPGARAKRQSKRKRGVPAQAPPPAAAAASAASATRPLHDIPPYPNDGSAKWTRFFHDVIVKRWSAFDVLSSAWYGHHEGYWDIVAALLQRWWPYEVLPPKLTAADDVRLARTPWLADSFHQKQVEKFAQWYGKQLANGSPQTATPLSRATALRWFLPSAESDLIALLGHPDRQKEARFRQRSSVPFSPSGPDTLSDGWTLDVGGIVLSMGWAPATGEVPQLLAMTVIPCSDQAFYQKPEDAPPAATKKQGSVQIYKFGFEKGAKSILHPSTKSPQLVHAICFEWGRATRLQWCPVPLDTDSSVGLLAILCADGKVRVLDVAKAPAKGKQGCFEEVQEPVATFEISNEDRLQCTCFTWINMNRIAVGHSDGTVSLWSILPTRLLQRHPVHSSYIIDITSGYPSYPFIVATMPVGSVAAVTDLNRPTSEMTYYPNLTISFQPNLMAWSEHLQGYMSAWPNSRPGGQNLGFMQVRLFPQVRHIMSTGSPPTCLAVGVCHPYVLIGSSDGSLWAANVFRKVLFVKERHCKLKIFQHEYRDLPDQAVKADEEGQDPPRGVCRILDGFQPELNQNPKSGITAANRQAKFEAEANGQHGRKGKAKAGNAKKAKPPKAGAGDGENELIDEASDDVEWGTGGPQGASIIDGPLVVHHALTRITAVAWNPNIEFGCWAAAAMGSGLVRIMDLGVGDEDEDEDRRRTGSSNGSPAGNHDSEASENGEAQSSPENGGGEREELEDNDEGFQRDED